MLKWPLLGLCIRSEPLLTIGCLWLSAASTQAADVRVYTDRAHPVSVPSGMSVVRLDEPTDVQAELSKNLPKDPAKASLLVQERLRSDGGQFNRRLSIAYQGVVQAWSLGILKLPAVVVDGRFVVYGDTDLTHALSLIQRYRGVHP